MGIIFSDACVAGLAVRTTRQHSVFNKREACFAQAQRVPLGKAWSPEGEKRSGLKTEFGWDESRKNLLSFRVRSLAVAMYALGIKALLGAD